MKKILCILAVLVLCNILVADSGRQARPSQKDFVFQEYAIRLSYIATKEHKTSTHYRGCEVPVVCYKKSWGELVHCSVERDEDQRMVLNVIFKSKDRLRIRTWPIEIFTDSDSGKKIMCYYKLQYPACDLMAK